MVFPRLLMSLTPTGRTSDCLNMILCVLVPGGTRREGAWLRRVGFLFGHLRESQGNRSCLSQIPKSRPGSACFWASGSLCRLVVTMCWRAESFRQQSTNAKRSKSVGLGGREAKTWKWDFSSFMVTKCYKDSMVFGPSSWFQRLHVKKFCRIPEGVKKILGQSVWEQPMGW